MNVALLVLLSLVAVAVGMPEPNPAKFNGTTSPYLVRKEKVLAFAAKRAQSRDGEGEEGSPCLMEEGYYVYDTEYMTTLTNERHDALAGGVLVSSDEKGCYFQTGFFTNYGFSDCGYYGAGYMMDYAAGSQYFDSVNYFSVSIFSPGKTEVPVQVCTYNDGCFGGRLTRAKLGEDGVDAYTAVESLCNTFDPLNQ